MSSTILYSFHENLQVQLYCLVYRWKISVSDRLTPLLQITQLMSCGFRIWLQTCLNPSAVYNSDPVLALESAFPPGCSHGSNALGRLYLNYLLSQLGTFLPEKKKFHHFIVTLYFSTKKSQNLHCRVGLKWLNYLHNSIFLWRRKTCHHKRIWFRH